MEVCQFLLLQRSLHKTPVIDTTKTGSITIHKYTEGTATGTAASGKEDASQVPAGAVPIKDVGFTIYKVQDAAKLADYYSTNPDKSSGCVRVLHRKWKKCSA